MILATLAILALCLAIGFILAYLDNKKMNNYWSFVLGALYTVLVHFIYSSVK